MMIKSLVIIFLLTIAQAERISEEKCKEYKDFALKEVRCVSCWRKVFYKCPNDRVFDLVGGSLSLLNEFPHMAALGWEDEDGNLSFKCGGSLISDRFILTAAHCGWNSDLESPPKWVRMGVHNLAIFEPSLVQLRIKKFIRHPRYDRFNKLNDIALIELENSVNFNRVSLRPACLQQQEFNETQVIATSWGEYDPYEEVMDKLMKLWLPVVDMDKFQQEFEDFSLNADKQICAGGVRGKDTCGGASGSPIQKLHLGTKCIHDIVGITAFGNFLCGTGHAVYTKVSHYLDWIEEIVWPRTENSTIFSNTTTESDY